MIARITAAEAAAILRDLARGREDGNGADVWPLYERAEDAMAAVVDLSAESDAHRTRADAAEADRDALRAECERLRAIVAGRTTAPTDAEIDAHAATGGVWLTCGLAGSVYPWREKESVAGHRDEGVTARWWALDRDGRPTAWPVPVATLPAALDAADRWRRERMTATKGP